MNRVVAPTLMGHGARCIAVTVIRMGNSYCLIFPSQKCRPGFGKRLLSLGCPVFWLRFSPARFPGLPVGGAVWQLAVDCCCPVSVAMKLSAAVVFCAVTSVSGQSADSGGVVGVPVTGEIGVQRTTAEIMGAQRVALPSRAPPRMPEHEIQGRENLPQNPAAKPVSSMTQSGGEAQIAQGSSVISTAELPSTWAPQTIGITFDAVTGPTENGAFPPDTMGAAGPSQFFLFVNGRLRTFNKGTGTADGVINANPNVFFNSVMTPISPPVVLNFTSDPQIRYR